MLFSARPRVARGQSSGWPHALALFALALVVAALIAGCGTAAKKPLSVRMGIVAGSQTLWRYLAQEKDSLLKPLGYEVEFINYPSEQALRVAFLAKEIDVAATLPPQVPALIEAGADVQYFLPNAWMRSTYPIVVPLDSPIKSIPDLAGKKLASFPQGHPGLAYWQAFVLANYGFWLQEKAVLTQTESPNQPLEAGQVDAAMVDSQAWSNLQPTGRYRLVSDLGREWARLAQSPHPLMYGGFVARREWIAANKGFVEDFIRVNYEALKLYKTDRGKVVQAASVYTGSNAPQIGAEGNQFIATYLGLDDVPPERMYISEADVADYRQIFSLLVKSGFLKKEPPPADTLFYRSDRAPR